MESLTPPEDPATVRGRLRSLNAAPSLFALRERFRRDWLADYLFKPHDLRPGLPAMMPRLPLNRYEAKLLAAHLVPPDEVHPAEDDPALVMRGRALYAAIGCGADRRRILAPTGRGANGAGVRRRFRPRGPGSGGVASL